MSCTLLMTEIDRFVTGIEVKEAVDLTVKYILENERHLHTKESAYSFWSGLSENRKLQLLLRALRQR